MSAPETPGEERTMRGESLSCEMGEHLRCKNTHSCGCVCHPKNKREVKQEWRGEECPCRWMPGALIFCPVHAAAPDLLAAAKHEQFCRACRFDGCACCNDCETTNAIRKAEGA